MRRIAQLVVRHRVLVVVAWIAVTAGLLPFAGKIEQELEVAAQVRGSEASAVEHMIGTRFKSPFARFAVLVASGIPAPDSPRGHAALSDVTAAVRAVSGVSGTFSYLDVADTLFLGAGRNGTFVVVGLDPASGRPDEMMPRLRSATTAATEGLKSANPDARLRWTGEIPINFDLRRTSADESRAAELRVLPITLVLLVLAFGALTAAVLPLIAGALAIVITLGVAVLVNHLWGLSILLQNTVSMIGLGVGIDYALLSVSRFREAMKAGLSPNDAAVDAAHHAGGTIALSGLTVMIGFAALMRVPLNELQSVGIGGVIVVGVSVLLAATLLPALLSWLGPRVDAGRIGRSRGRGMMENRWRAWGRWVVAHPWLVLLVAGLPTAALAWQAQRLRAELPRGNWLPAGIESEAALEDLARMKRGGVVNELRVVVSFPEAINVYEANGWEATRRITAAILRDPRVGRVQSVTTVVPTIVPDLRVLSTMPASTLRTLVSGDRHAALLEVVPRDQVDFNDLTSLTRDLRNLDVPAITGIPGASLGVGGMPAFNADYLDVIATRFAGVISLVVGVTLVALMIGFRSVLVPVKALALNLLSVAASFGALVLVFQDGHGARLVGLSAPLGAVFPAVPILVFCIVFGLSMDYEVFLVSRIAEARRAGASDDDAIVEGLARTGGVITSAAAIMIAVFWAFTLGSFLFVKVLGLALATAVLVDATVVRMAIGPALLKLAGRWNWWPGPSRIEREKTD